MDDLIMTYVGYIMNTQIKKKPTYAGIVVGESSCWLADIHTQVMWYSTCHM